MNISTYALKPRFQKLLASIRDWLIRHHCSANQITLFSCLLCIGYAGLSAGSHYTQLWLVFLPVFLLIRMALNALDGMVASATNTQSALGSVLNEVCDIISDLALLSAFALILPVSIGLWWGLIILAMLAEFISLAVYQAIGDRSFSGPFGKSDRALYLGILALLLFFSLPLWVIDSYIVLGLLLALMTIWNRFKVVI